MAIYSRLLPNVVVYKYGVKIFYCTFSRNSVLGSVNEKKIRAMAAGKAVFCCDISEFDGVLIGSDWYGEYPPPRQDLVDFNHCYRRVDSRQQSTLNGGLLTRNRPTGFSHG